MNSAVINARMGLVQWSMLVLLSMLWGGSYFFVEIALEEWSPLLIVAVRIVVASIVIWGIVLAAGLPVPRFRAAWIAFFFMGLLNNVFPFLLIVWGQKEIESGLRLGTEGNRVWTRSHTHRGRTDFFGDRRRRVAKRRANNTSQVAGCRAGTHRRRCSNRPECARRP
jgi:hypothetical protein